MSADGARKYNATQPENLTAERARQDRVTGSVTMRICLNPRLVVKTPQNGVRVPLPPRLSIFQPCAHDETLYCGIKLFPPVIRSLPVPTGQQRLDNPTEQQAASHLNVTGRY